MCAVNCMHSLTVHLHDTEFIDIWLIVFGRIHVSVCVRLCLAASVSSSLCLAVSDVVCVLCQASKPLSLPVSVCLSADSVCYRT